MKTQSNLPTAVAAFILLIPNVVTADQQGVADGGFVEDFEDGNLERWGVDQQEAQRDNRVPTVLEIAKDAGKAALHLKGDFHNRVFLKDKTFKDFSMTVRMRKAGGNYAGVVVRDHWRVYLQMKCFLSLNTDCREWESKGELLKSAETFAGYHDLRVVCAGPLLHAFVDGEPVWRYKIPTAEGRIGFYCHGNGEAYYDRLQIEPEVAPQYYLLVEPETPQRCLVFDPDDDVTLRFRVSNYSRSTQPVTIAAAVKTWSGDLVTGTIRQEIEAAAGEENVAEFDMGRLARGFYRIDLEASCQGKEVCGVDDLPLAIQQRGTGEFKAPTIPVAAYYKYYNKRSPVYVNTYAHAAARNLKDHHFNAVVAGPSFTRETVDIFQSYGIATIARGQFLDHPAVIATLLGDEPKPDEIDGLKQDYERVGQSFDKPITTCMVGEAMGLGGEGDPVRIWEQLSPELRCFRWYGIKKSFYGILHDLKYKGVLPLSSVLRIAEASSDTPYWFVAPSLGKTEHESYFHKPTPAETKGLMHLALARGADGILFWAFQSHGSWPCFVEQQSLEPTDGNYEAAAEVAANIAAHADLIKSLEHGGLDVRCPSPVVDAVPRQSSRDNKLYVYAVNKDAEHSVTTQLRLWADRWVWTSARDVFTGEDLEVKPDEEGYLSAAVTLGPGEGRLLATDVANRE